MEILMAPYTILFKKNKIALQTSIDHNKRIQKDTVDTADMKVEFKL